MNDNLDIIRRINFFQECGIMHPHTCGNDSRHRPLHPQLVNGQIILQCPDCQYTQDHYYAPSQDVIDHWTSDPFYKSIIEAHQDVVGKGF